VFWGAFISGTAGDALFHLVLHHITYCTCGTLAKCETTARTPREDEKI